MPVNPARFRGRYDDAKVSFAGPAMNLLLAAICVLAYGIWIGAAGGYWWQDVNVSDTLFKNTQTFFRVGVMINLVGVIFNLLPLPPLDGSRILASLSTSYRRFLEGEETQRIARVAFFALFIFGGQYVFDAAFAATDRATSVVVRVLAPRAGP
jgi:Zn-dependent protease